MFLYWLLQHTVERLNGGKEEEKSAMCRLICHLLGVIALSIKTRQLLSHVSFCETPADSDRNCLTVAVSSMLTRANPLLAVVVAIVDALLQIFLLVRHPSIPVWPVPPTVLYITQLNVSNIMEISQATPFYLRLSSSYPALHNQS